MRGKSVVAGVGHTAYGKHPGRDRISLIVEACANAIADTGIEKSMVDGVLVKMATSEPSILYGQKVAEALGLQPKVGAALDQGGAANIALIAYAAMSDVAQLYDCFTVTVLLTLEDYGFAPRGEAGAFVRDRGIAPDGDFPINTSGGLLSESGTPGLQLVIEGVRQMRGDANLQVERARTCLVSNQGGTMHTHSTLIMGEPT